MSEKEENEKKNKTKKKKSKKKKKNKKDKYLCFNAVMTLLNDCPAAKALVSTQLGQEEGLLSSPKRAGAKPLREVGKTAFSGIIKLHLINLVRILLESRPSACSHEEFIQTASENPRARHVSFLSSAFPICISSCLNRKGMIQTSWSAKMPRGSVLSSEEMRRQIPIVILFKEYLCIF